MGELRRSHIEITKVEEKIGADYFKVSVASSDSRVSDEYRTIAVTNAFKGKMDGRTVKLYGGSTLGSFDGYNFVQNGNFYTTSIKITETQTKITAHVGAGAFSRGTLVFMKG